MIRMLGSAPSRVVRVAKLRAMFARLGRKAVKVTKIKSKIRHTKRLLNPFPYVHRIDNAQTVRYVKHRAASQMATRIKSRQNKMWIDVHRDSTKLPKSISSLKVSVKPFPKRYHTAAHKALKNTFLKVVAPVGAAYLGASSYGSYKYGQHFGKKPKNIKKKMTPYHVALVGGVLGGIGFRSGQRESRRLHKVRRTKSR